MNNQYLNAAYQILILKYDYIPFDPSMTQERSTGVKVLQHASKYKQTILELIDGDALSVEVLVNELKISYHLVETAATKVRVESLKILVFKAEPTLEKLSLLKLYQESNEGLPSLIMVNQTKNLVLGNQAPPEVLRLLKKLFRMDLAEFETESDWQHLCQVKTERETIVMRAQKPIVTYLLIGINILVWLGLFLVSLKGKFSYDQLLIVYGAKEVSKILAGEYWRFLTAVFLHGDLTHLAINCYSLYVMGLTVERIYGHGKYLGVYLLAGVFGNIGSFVFSTSPGIGASGAIFGLLGALLYFGVENWYAFKKYFGTNLLFVLILNAGLGFSIPRIDNFAHLGGLIGGFLAANALKLRETVFYKYALAWVLLLGVAVGGFYAGFHQPVNLYYAQIEQASKEMDSGRANPAQMELLAVKAIKSGKLSHELQVRAYWLLIRAEDAQAKYREALQNAEKLTQLSPFEGHYLKGVILANLGEYQQAQMELLVAEEARPGIKEVQNLLRKLAVEMKK